MDLRYYQRDAITAVVEARARGRKRVMVVLPTGTGKTVVFGTMIKEHLPDTTLVLAHRDELIKQAAEKIRAIAPELAMSIGIVKGRHDQTRAPIVVASVQTLARKARLARLPKSFKRVIVDEAHHAAARSYVEIFNHLDDDVEIIGFTATPERHDKKRLDSVFEEIVYARSIEDMVREGFLVPPKGKRIVASDLDLAGVKKSAGDFQAKDLGRAMEESGATADVLKAFAEHAAERKTIVFVPTVKLAKEMAYAFERDGVVAREINGKTEGHIRRSILSRFERGEIQVIVNVGVLTEGFDDPAVSCVIIARPTKSRIMYTQMIGRGLRLFPDKSDCLVLDLAGASEDLSIQSLPGMFGVEEIREGETAIEAMDRERIERERVDAAKAAARQAAAERRVAWKPNRRRRRHHDHADIGFFDRDRLHWLKHDERWILDAGEGDLVVLDKQANGSWWVLLLKEHVARPLQRNLDLGYAQGVAEEVIRHRAALGINDKKAKWRREKPSPGQLGRLRRLGADQHPETKGEAADAITLAVARDRLERFDGAMIEREGTTEPVPA